MDRTPRHGLVPPRTRAARAAVPFALGVVATAALAGPAGAAGDPPAGPVVDADLPAFPIGTSVWPEPGDPWPDPLRGPLILLDTDGAAEALAGLPRSRRGGIDASVAAPPLGAALPTTAGGIEAGACYAEVLVPASARLEPVEVVVREPSERFEVTEPELVETTREVVVRDAHERIVAVAPVTRVEPRTLEVSPAGSRLVRGTLDGTVPASPAELAAIGAAGVDVDAVPVGSCVNEWYEAPERRTVTRRVLVAEPTERLDVAPARFEDLQLPVETTPAHVRLVEIPAAWRDAEREVLVEPATVTWEPGEGLVERIDEATGRLMCRVDVPAKHVRVPVRELQTPAMVTPIERAATVETVPASRLLSEARELRRPVAAKFETLELEMPVTAPGAGDWTWLPGDVRPLESAHERTGRAVCRQAVPAVTASWQRETVAAPGRFEREAVPAETVDVDVLELAAKATGEPVPVPAKTLRLTRRTHLSDAHLEWRPVLCRTNLTETVVRRLQGALDAAGYSPDGIDGLLGPGTAGAVERYQRARGLATGGLTLETLESLGVTLGPVTAEDAAR